MENCYKVLIVDDESLARHRIKRFLANDKRIEFIFEAEDTDAALKKITEEKPDILFLDVQMPGGSGFDLLETLRQNYPQLLIITVFVTAFDEFALKAFEYHAVDYLLKPFEQEKLKKSFDYAIKQIENKNLSDYREKILKLTEFVQPEKVFPEWISDKKDDKVLFYKTDEIKWIEAHGNYVLIYLLNAKCMLREKMDTIEEKLDPKKFLRIHRSTIINVNFINELENWGGGEFKVVMNGGKSFSVSRSYKNSFNKFLDNNVL